MTISNSGLNAIRSAYGRKIDEVVRKIDYREIAILLYRIIENQKISEADRREFLCEALLISDEDYRYLTDLARDIYGDLSDLIRQESEIG